MVRSVFSERDTDFFLILAKRGGLSRPASLLLYLTHPTPPLQRQARRETLYLTRI